MKESLAHHPSKMPTLRKRVCIFGGSFNPVHCGHLQLGTAVLAQNKADEVWFLLSPHNPHKCQTDLLADNLRFSLLTQALSDQPGLIACDFELSLPRPSYTAHTLLALRTRYTDYDFSLLIGQDNWEKFHFWHQPEDILMHHNVLVYPRSTEKSTVPNVSSHQCANEATQQVIFNPHLAHWAQHMPLRIDLISAPLLPISSSLIRQRIAHQQDISTLVPSAIVHDCQRLYQGQYK